MKEGGSFRCLDCSILGRDNGEPKGLGAGVSGSRTGEDAHEVLAQPVREGDRESSEGKLEARLLQGPRDH